MGLIQTEIRSTIVSSKKVSEIFRATPTPAFIVTALAFVEAEVVVPSLTAVGPVGLVVVIAPRTAVVVAAATVPSGCAAVADVIVCTAAALVTSPLVTGIAPTLGVASPSAAHVFPPAAFAIAVTVATVSAAAPAPSATAPSLAPLCQLASADAAMESVGAMGHSATPPMG